MQASRIIAGLGACALLALSPAAAGAAGGKKKPKKAPAAVVAESTQTTTAAGVLSLSANCPAKTIATGGGFSSDLEFAGGSGDSHIVYESKRLGKTGWTIAVLRADNPPAGNPVPVTVYASCRSPLLRAKKAKKPKGKAAAEKKAKPRRLVLREAAGSAALAPSQVVPATAQCPTGQRVVSGGFTSSPTPIGPPTPSFALVTESRRASAGAWTAAALNSNGDPRTLTALAYCAKGVAVAETTGSAALAASNPPATFGSATPTTGACPAKRTILGGGFSAAANPALPAVIESAPSGRSWKGRAVNLSTTTSSFSVFGYCL